MKQSDVNKLVNIVMKSIGKTFGWKCKEGCLIQKKGNLFFAFSLFGYSKANKINYTLCYKWFDFDEVLWNIVDLQENMRQPLSFHYFGSWTAPTMTVKEEELANSEWDYDSLLELISNLFKGIDDFTDKKSKEITNIDENIRYVEYLFHELLLKYPDTAVNIFKEKLMTSMLKKDYGIALNITRDRIAENDNGGFLCGDKSFYELAEEYIQDL